MSFKRVHPTVEFGVLWEVGTPPQHDVTTIIPPLRPLLLPLLPLQPVLTLYHTDRLLH